MVQLLSCLSLWRRLMVGWACLVGTLTLSTQLLKACKTYCSLHLPWYFESMASACYVWPEQVWCTSPAWSYLFVVLTTMSFRIGPKEIFFAESSSAPYWTYVGVLSSPTLYGVHKWSLSRRKEDAGVSSSGTPCTTAGGSYLLSPRQGSGVGLVRWTSEARDSVGRRLLLSRAL